MFDQGYHINPSTIVNVWLSNDESATIARAGFDVIHSYGWYLDQQVPGQPTNYFWQDTWKNFYLNDPLFNTTLTPAQQLHILGTWQQTADNRQQTADNRPGCAVRLVGMFWNRW